MAISCGSEVEAKAARSVKDSSLSAHQAGCFRGPVIPQAGYAKGNEQRLAAQACATYKGVIA